MGVAGIRETTHTEADMQSTDDYLKLDDSEFIEERRGDSGAAHRR